MYVWPTQSWPLSTLTPAQWDSWEHDGFLIVPGVINASAVAAAASAIRTFVGANDSELASWYANTLDIYEDRTPSGARPHHGPCGMVNLCHHRAIWALRQEPMLHGVFADLYGTRRLYVTVDRQHFKPPQNPAHPAWSDAGAVHKGLHWDVDTRRAAWPVPYVIQGTLLPPLPCPLPFPALPCPACPALPCLPCLPACLPCLPAHPRRTRHYEPSLRKVWSISRTPQPSRVRCAWCLASTAGSLTPPWFLPKLDADPNPYILKLTLILTLTLTMILTLTPPPTLPEP